MRRPLFDELYAAHAAAVKGMIWLLGVPRDERADVAQQVWIVVFRTLGSYDGRLENALAWLGVIIRNAVRDWRRSWKRHPERCTWIEEEADELIAGPMDRQTPEAILEAYESRAALTALLVHAIVDDDRREAILLHGVMGLTVPEVAAATGVGFAKAQWRLKRAAGEIRRAVAAMSEMDKERLVP